MKTKGLGSLLKKIFRFFGAKPKKGCGCEERAELLDRLFPFK